MTSKELPETTQNLDKSVLMNRVERRKKLKWLKNELKTHILKKPLKKITFTPDVDLSTEEMQSNIHILKAWATRYGTLVRKIKELEEYGS